MLEHLYGFFAEVQGRSSEIVGRRSSGMSPLNSRVEQCLGILREGLAAVPASFYRVTTTYSPPGIVRERAFCYELYHRMRLTIAAGSELSLHGEIDKSGHSAFERLHQKNPDFVFHVPGVMEHNTLVVEVKGELSRRGAGIKKDFGTLLTFVADYQYGAGAFVLFNHSLEDFADTMGVRLAELARRPEAQRVVVMCKADSQSVVEESSLADLMPEG